MHFPSAGNLQSTLHFIALTQTKRLRKELIYILIHNKRPSKLCLINYCKHPCSFLFWKLNIYLFVFSLQKCLAHFLLQKRWRNKGFKSTSDNINGGSLEITHVFHLSIITSYRKKYFKISLLPLVKIKFD